MEAESTLVLSLALSALVAGVVTLAIELIAKPHLERRKERILRQHRKMWDFSEALADLSERLDWLNSWSRQESFELEQFEREIDSVSSEFRRTESLFHAVSGRLPAAIAHEFSYSAGRHYPIFDSASEIRRLPPGERPQRYAVFMQDLGTNLSIPTAFLDLPWWRMMRKRQLVRGAEERQRLRFADDDEEEDDSPPGPFFEP